MKAPPRYRKLLRLAALLVAPLALGGCMTAAALMGEAQRRQQLYDPADYAWFFAGGAGAITGSAADETDAGLVTCAGRSVFLVPDGPHTRGKTTGLASHRDGNQGFAAGSYPTSLLEYWNDESATALVRRAACDGSGRFSFSGLAAGPYLVQAEVGRGAFLHMLVQAPRSSAADLRIVRRCGNALVRESGSPIGETRYQCTVRDENRPLRNLLIGR